MSFVLLAIGFLGCAINDDGVVVLVFKMYD